MGRFVIGISAAIESARWAVWQDVETNISQRTYSVGVADAGGLPVILPASESGERAPDELLDLLDGIVLAGGADIDPAAYGAVADPRTVGFRAERDRFELALARRALERDLPVLGVCRGMELLNVACGGTLDQHLADVETHLHTPGRFSDHEVRLEPGSLAARAVGRERAAVRSHHHQGVAKLGRGVVASGWAEPGGAVEAIEIPDSRWALGVLWHAEEERPSPVIAALTGAARSQRVAA
ncbi:MAG: peptidase [Solirubrobacterales bacterium]|jgi:putative glutamine amidotransferase|nr:peptidase [Solirubrobacterales bacterium]